MLYVINELNLCWLRGEVYCCVEWLVVDPRLFQEYIFVPDLTDSFSEKFVLIPEGNYLFWNIIACYELKITGNLFKNSPFGSKAVRYDRFVPILYTSHIYIRLDDNDPMRYNLLFDEKKIM